jgi:hypothetical protein
VICGLICFVGLANWVIFTAHIPNNVVDYLMPGTGRYGFNGGADMFVFISGYTLAFVYAQMFVDRRTRATDRAPAIAAI